MQKTNKDARTILEYCTGSTLEVTMEHHATGISATYKGTLGITFKTRKKLYERLVWLCERAIKDQIKVMKEGHL